SSWEQPALVRAARQSPNINPLYLKPMVAILGATDVAQVGGVVVIIDMLFKSERVLFHSLGRSALLALGAQLFNGDCVAAQLRAPIGAAKNSLFETAPAHSQNWCQR